jgi:TolB protein
MMPAVAREVARAAVALVATLVATTSVATLPAVLHAQDQGVRIGLTYAAGTRPGVYILPTRAPLGDSLRAIIARNLDFGNRVAVIAPDSGPPVSGTLNYPMFARLGAAAVVRLEQPMGGGISAEVHEVGAARLLRKLEPPLTAEPLSPEWRLAVHRLSDEIEELVTGVRGIAATRVLFNREGTIWQIDSDGANARALPGIGSAISPAWHPGMQMIAYQQWADDGSHVVVRDLGSGRVRRLSFAVGTNITPAFSPDGKDVVFAHGVDATELWKVPLEGGEGPVRLTVGRGRESAQPSYSPDGRRIAFATGRLGRPEIYIISADGADPEWLTTTGFGDQSYRSDPAWAPDGRSVAFQTQIEGRFQVATINLRDRSVKQHTIEGINEQPAWAPDGRHLVFTSNRGGSRQLWVLDTESGRMRQLTTGTPARMGAWSPRMLGTR